MFFYLWFYKDILFYVSICLVLIAYLFLSFHRKGNSIDKKKITSVSFLLLLSLIFASYFINAAVKAEYMDFTGTITNIFQGRRHDTILNSSIEIADPADGETIVIQVPFTWVSNYDLRLGDTISVTYLPENHFVRSINDVWSPIDLEPQTSSSVLDEWS